MTMHRFDGPGTLSRRSMLKGAAAVPVAALGAGLLPSRALAQAQAVTMWHGWAGADNTTTLN